jgi:hypothetical protein
MKLHVLFNDDGHILAAVQLDSAVPVRVRPMPDEQARHRTADVFVPCEYQHYDLAAICQRLRVDVKGQFPDLKAKD